MSHEKIWAKTSQITKVALWWSATVYADESSGVHCFLLILADSI